MHYYETISWYDTARGVATYTTSPPVTGLGVSSSMLVGTIGGMRHGDQPRWIWKGEKPMEVLTVFMIQK
jgi:hypothetical protein